ncbi:MAG: cobalt ECF transporter T component CbiQ [Brevinematia bacterium]
MNLSKGHFYSLSMFFNSLKFRIYKLDMRLKLLFVISVLFINVIFRDLFFSLFILSNVVFWSIFFRIDFKDIFHMLKFPLLFGIFILILQSTMELGTQKFKLFFIDLYIEGIIKGFTIFFIILSGVWLIAILSKISSTEEFLDAVRSIGIPILVIDIVIMMYRYVFLLKEEVLRIYTAQYVRLGYINFFTSIRSFGQLWGIVLVNSVLRTSRIAEAMIARGYSDKMFYHKKEKFKFLELLFTLAYLVLVCFVGLLSKGLV